MKETSMKTRLALVAAALFRAACASDLGKADSAPASIRANTAAEKSEVLAAVASGGQQGVVEQ